MNNGMISGKYDTYICNRICADNLQFGFAQQKLYGEYGKGYKHLGISLLILCSLKRSTLEFCGTETRC